MTYFGYRAQIDGEESCLQNIKQVQSIHFEEAHPLYQERKTKAQVKDE